MNCTAHVLRALRCSWNAHTSQGTSVIFRSIFTRPAVLDAPHVGDDLSQFNHRDHIGGASLSDHIRHERSAHHLNFHVLDVNSGPPVIGVSYHGAELLACQANSLPGPLAKQGPFRKGSHYGAVNLNYLLGSHVLTGGPGMENMQADAATAQMIMKTLLPPRLHHKVHAYGTLLCTESQGSHPDSTVMLINALSVALLAAGVPLLGPAAAVRVAALGTSGRIRVNPSRSERKHASAELLYVASSNGVLLADCNGALSISRGGGGQPWSAVGDLLEVAEDAARHVTDAQMELLQSMGRQPKFARDGGQVGESAAEAADTLPASVEHAIDAILDDTELTGPQVAQALAALERKVVATVARSAKKEAAAPGLRVRALFQEAVKGRVLTVIKQGKRPCSARGPMECRRVHHALLDLPGAHGVGTVYLEKGTAVLASSTVASGAERLQSRHVQDEQTGLQAACHFDATEDLHLALRPLDPGEVPKLHAMDAIASAHVSSVLSPVLDKGIGAARVQMDAVPIGAGPDGGVLAASMMASHLALVAAGARAVPPVASLGLAGFLLHGSKPGHHSSDPSSLPHPDNTQLEVLLDPTALEERCSDLQMTLTGNTDGMLALRVHAGFNAGASRSAISNHIETIYGSEEFRRLVQQVSGPAPVLKGLLGHSLTAPSTRVASVFAPKHPSGATREQMTYFEQHPSTWTSDVQPHHGKVPVNPRSWSKLTSEIIAKVERGGARVQAVNGNEVLVWAPTAAQYFKAKEDLMDVFASRFTGSTGAQAPAARPANPTVADATSRPPKPAVEELVEGQLYWSEVVAVFDYGAFVRVSNGMSGLCHISQLSESRIDDIYAHVQVGDSVRVMYTGEGPKGHTFSVKKMLSGKRAEDLRSDMPPKGAPNLPERGVPRDEISNATKEGVHVEAAA